MSVIAAATKPAEKARFLTSTIGQKTVMATTGVVLFGFVVVHMLGNLQVYIGATKLNAYAETLRSTPALLWTTRVVLLVSVLAHAIFGMRLTRLRSEARPVGYRMKKNVKSSVSSRTMAVSGLLIFFFVVYHLLHLTLGTAHPSFDEANVYGNVVTGFRVVPAALAYIVAMVGLGVHLHHGVWSMFQSVGVGHPRWNAAVRRVASLAAAGIALANVSIPVAVLTGLIH
jgi:succinate dehydrogenase / fumarate reductase cytochrome b subunit